MLEPILTTITVPFHPVLNRLTDDKEAVVDLDVCLSNRRGILTADIVGLTPKEADTIVSLNRGTFERAWYEFFRE